VIDRTAPQYYTRHFKKQELSVLPQFELTPKALANFSPGLERSDNPGAVTSKTESTLKALHRSNAFSVARFIHVRCPGLSLRSNPGLKLANAFGVK